MLVPVLAALIQVAACSTPLRVEVPAPAPVANSVDLLRRHSVFADREGRPIRILEESQDGAPTLTDAEYGSELSRMMNALEADRPTRIVISIHGGLIGKGEAAEQNLATLQAVRAFNDSTGTRIYPLFLNWRSGLFDSYTEHAWRLRSGRRPWWGPPTSVGQVPVDLAIGVARTPMTVGTQILNVPGTLWWGEDYRDAYDRLRSQFGDSTEPAVSLGEYRPAFDLWITLLTVVTSPTRLLVPFVDGVGRPAWDAMKRRTATVFRRPDEFEAENAGAEGFVPRSGAFGVFLDSLAIRAWRWQQVPEVVLVGHSMGAIVANRILQQYPSLPVMRIVYMAGAASIQDTFDAVVPFLEMNPRVCFYNLTLHPRAEAREQFLGWLGPGGSLLEWIDGYLEQVNTPVDRVVGKFENVVVASHLLPEGIRNRVHIKGFEVSPDQPKPRRHGQFNDGDVPYWTSDFWRTSPPEGIPPRDCPG